MYLWALSKIVGTKSSVGTPFSSCESGGYQERANTPNRKKEKKMNTETRMTAGILLRKKGGRGTMRIKVLTKEKYLPLTLLCYIS